MNSKFGAKVLVGLLYGQALFGLLAVAAVIMKDPGEGASRHTAASQAYHVADAGLTSAQ